MQGHARDSGSCPKKTLSSWKGFGKALLKARLECGGQIAGSRDQLVHNYLIG